MNPVPDTSQGAVPSPLGAREIDGSVGKSSLTSMGA